MNKPYNNGEWTQALTQTRLQEVLLYDCKSGIFRWKRSNKLAGCLRKDGYITIRIDNRAYLAHRLAILYVEGVFPSQQVDHKDRIRSNNMYINLRSATPRENNFNRSTFRDLPVGIYLVKRKGRAGMWYRTSIQVYGKQYSSYFRELEKAIEWRKTKENELFV
jgi:hypothetical protein